MSRRPRLAWLLLPLATLTAAASGILASGATFTSTSTGNVAVTAANDWTPPVVSVIPTAPVIAGTTTISATATDARSQVASVVMEYATVGGDWQVLCTDNTAPWSCAWSTTSVPDGDYRLRATATDTAGYRATSAEVSTRVANTPSVLPLRAHDVQVTSGSEPGLPSAGDRITLTYSGQVDLGTVKAGWNGAAMPVAVSFHGKNVANGPVPGSDWARFDDAALGTLAFTRSLQYVHPNRSATVSATMVASTHTLVGTPVTVVEITLGTVTSGTSDLRQENKAGTVQWFPSTSVRSRAGAACLADAATESGVPDTDF